jgi:hypothetical protein
MLALCCLDVLFAVASGHSQHLSVGQLQQRFQWQEAVLSAHTVSSRAAAALTD